jgi:pectate lyase
MNQFFLYIISLVLLSSCYAQKPVSPAASGDNLPAAFPGAEGFGKNATGGRGGKMYIVSNLGDNGAGSFREAAEAKGKRIIVFAVSGTIHLEKKLSIKGDVTIAGQTAPGDGICIADNSVGLGGDNIIVRYLRFRMGDKYQKGGMVDGNGGDDAFGGTKRSHIIIDHCSMSWSTDEVFSVYSGDSTTLQWNIISEPLNYSYHFETGDKDYEHHGFGGIWGGAHLTAHHNLFAHCNNRNPRFNGIRTSPQELVDYCNNVIYNWGGNNIYAGEGGSYNLVNNYLKYGPETKENVKYQVVNPGNKLPEISFGKFYVAGNYVDGAKDVTANNWLGIRMGNNGTEEDKRRAVIDQPHPVVHTALQPATGAFDAVLAKAGASYRRDTLDMRIISDVKNRRGKFIDVQGGHPHGTEYELTVTAWPALQSLPVPPDTDKDGMPDAWEIKNGLNPNDATDAAQNKLHPFYTNIEVYINSILQ